MTDETPRPEPITEPIETAAAQPGPAQHGEASAAAAAPPAGQPAGVLPPVSRWRRPVGGHWSGRRVPLLVTAAALLLGCVLGAGAVAVGAAFSGDHRHGDDRGFHQRDGRDDARGDRNGDRSGDRDGRRDDRGQGDRDAPDSTPPSAPASAPPAPAPSASDQPSSPAPSGT